MPATITGKVYDDVNHSGTFNLGEPGIANAFVVIRDPNGVCTLVQTNGNGDYSFAGLNLAGDYTVYETVANPGATCPPTTFTQPAGFTNSTDIRTRTVNITQTNIDNNDTISGLNFGHDNANSIACVAIGFQTAGTLLFRENLVTGSSELICDLGIATNSLGYNEQDGYLYTLSGNTLYRIDDDCNLTNIGIVENLPGNVVGTIDTNGYYYITASNLPNYYTVDLTSPDSPTWGQLVDPTAGFVLDTSPYGTPYVGVPFIDSSDWAYNAADGFIYALRNSNGVLRRLDPLTGVVTDIPTVGTGSGSYGAAYADLDGNLYFIENVTGNLYRVTTDGASCASARVEVDYGDAPDTDPLTQGTGNYRTLLASSGPRHQIGLNTLFLGTQVTAEDDAYQSPDALGDDQIQGIQDDAATLPLPDLYLSSTTYSVDVQVTNETGEDANLYAWVDFNQDGVFQTDESFATVVSSQIGTQTVTLSFNKPVTTTLTPGDTFVRMRLTTDDLVNAGGATDEDTRSYGPAGDGEVEDYLVVIQPDPELTLVKSVDFLYADIGDVLTYTIVVENTGEVDALNIDFVDIIPNDTTYVAGSLTVDGLPTAGNLNTGIPLSDLAPGENHIVQFQVTVDTIPTPNPIPNDASASFENIVGDSFSENSNTVFTQVNQAILTIVKDVDLTYADIGDTLTYSFVIENIGNAPATNIILTDIIPNDTTFVPSSVVVGGLPSPDNPETGINLPSIPAGDSLAVSFQVTVDTIPTPNPIPDTGTIDYQYTVDPTQAPVSDSTDSNTVFTQVNHAELIGDNGENFVKSVDKAFADVGEILTYSFSIENTGNVDATNIVLTDIIPNDTTFVQGSVLVNGLPSTDNPVTGIDIPDIGPAESETVSFQVVVDRLPTPNPIPDTGSLDYEYRVDPAEPLVSAGGDSNTVLTQVNTADLIGDNGENFVKSVDLAYAAIGDVLTYSFSIENTGNVDATNIILTDVIPNDTTFIPNSVLVNGGATGEDPESGISIPNIIPGGSATVSFQVVVDRLPTPNPIPDTGNLEYEYLVDPAEQPVSGGGDSNTVFTQVNTADLTGDNFIKSANPQVVEVGDEVTYTYTIANTGNVAATNIVLVDPLPDAVSFVPGSTLINGVTSSDSPESGISIPDIGAGEVAVVIIRALVNEIPIPNPMPNVGSISYEYSVDPADPPVVDGGDSNEVEVEVVEVGLEIVKMEDKMVALPGEEVTYTIAISNTGNVLLQNLIFTDQIPAGTSFVEDSLVIDGVPRVGENPEVGIDIGNLAPAEFVTVIFRVVIDDPATENLIINQSSVDYQVQIEPAGEIEDRSQDSNQVELIVEEGELTIVKSADVKEAKVGDAITYTIVVTNTGTVTAENVVINDELDESVVLVANSVKINGVQAPGLNPSNGIDLGDIEPGEEVVVSFEVVVESIPCPAELVNVVTANYEVNLESRLDTLNVTDESNGVMVDIELKIFKQISVDETLEIPSQKPDAEDVLEVVVEVEITNSNLIPIPIVESYEGQRLRGYKLIVEGVLKQLVSYVADRAEQDVHAAHFEVPFSTFLITPADFNPNDKIVVNIVVEDVYIELLDPRTIFKNITLLVKVNSEE